MANKHVEFHVTPADGLRYWIAVDERDVNLVNGGGGLDLDDVEEHVLVWWMVGNPGDSLAIVGLEGKRPVVTVKESKVPTGSYKGAGYRKFKV